MTYFMFVLYIVWYSEVLPQIFNIKTQNKIYVIYYNELSFIKIHSNLRVFKIITNKICVI